MAPTCGGPSRPDEAKTIVVGDRIVQKSRAFTLHIDTTLVDIKNSIYVFRVEQIDGPALLLKAKRPTSSRLSASTPNPPSATATAASSGAR
jgi:hypothetical protein